MNDPPPPPTKARLLSLAFVMVLKAVHRTWRIETIGLERFDAMREGGERVLVAFWHGKYLPLFTLLQGRSACVFSSRSFRGEVLCGICRRFGYQCVQIPEHGGDRAIALMSDALADRRVAGIAVDGPTGPYHVVRRGAIQLAADLGMALLPASFAARRGKVLTRRWDRMEIPLPFTRLCLAFGDPVPVPPDLAGKSIDDWEKQLHDGLEEAERRAISRLALQQHHKNHRKGW